MNNKILILTPITGLNLERKFKGNLIEIISDPILESLKADDSVIAIFVNPNKSKLYINEKLLRIGASSLLIDIERQLYHYTLGRYANKEKIAMS